MRQLLNGVLFAIVSGLAAAGQTLVTGATVDTQGFEDVLIKCKLGAITATGTATLKAAQGNAADGSDKADLEGSAVTATDADGNKYLIIEIHRPQERYITPILTRATANSVIESIEVLLSNPSHVPLVQTSVAKSVALITPAEGVA